MSGWKIFNNVVVAYELSHFLKKKRSGRKGWREAKLDISKAFDHVEWGSLEHTMQEMHFLGRCIKLVMLCLRPVTFSFFINRRVVGMVAPSQGL